MDIPHRHDECFLMHRRGSIYRTRPIPNDVNPTNPKRGNPANPVARLCMGPLQKKRGKFPLDMGAERNHGTTEHLINIFPSIVGVRFIEPAQSQTMSIRPNPKRCQSGQSHICMCGRHKWGPYKKPGTIPIGYGGRTKSRNIR
jgi:hypothetical protein